VKFSDYQQASARTLNRAVATNEALTNYALGIAGETGEVVEMVKKHVFHGKAMNLADVEKELGDVLWYVAAVASTLGLDLTAIAQRNVDKLKTRYPDGFVEGGGIR